MTGPTRPCALPFLQKSFADYTIASIVCCKHAFCACFQPITAYADHVASIVFQAVPQWISTSKFDAMVTARKEARVSVQVQLQAQ